MKNFSAFCLLVVLPLASSFACSSQDDSPSTPADAVDASAASDAAPDGQRADAAPVIDAAPDGQRADAAPADAAPRTVVRITEGVTAPTTWVHTNLYVIGASIPVTAALTIEPDTIVKFESGTSISIGASGSILADASSASTPCLFTSVKDDANGGDTNGDGTASVPARGDWGYIAVNENGSTFNYCRFLYGGGNMPYTGTLMLDDNVSATITNCTFGHNQGGTLTDTRAAALNAGGGAAATVIKGNTFFDNDIPLVISGSFSLDDSNVFRETAASGAVTNTYNGIFWGGSYALSGDISWTNTRVPYVIINHPLGIAAGSSLTLGDNVVVKFDLGQRIDVAGRLIANATTGILFTSIRDDSVGGDTNGDGAVTTAAPGDWGYITLSADGSLLHRARFSYGGSAKPYHGTVAVAANHTATITGCTFSHNAGGTLSDNRAAALNLGEAGAGTVITGNVFYGNDMPLVIDGLVNIDASNVFHGADAAAGATITNTYNGIFMDGVGHTVNGSVTWSNTEVAYVLYDTVLTIDTGGTLTLGNDVVVKLEKAGRIDLAPGNLTQGTGDFFTSLRDDAWLGDTNGDANATAPAKGDWAGVDICQGGPCAWATWGNILYAAHP